MEGIIPINYVKIIFRDFFIVKHIAFKDLYVLEFVFLEISFTVLNGLNIDVSANDFYFRSTESHFHKSASTTSTDLKKV